MARPDTGGTSCPGLTANDTPLSFLPMKRFSGRFLLCTALLYLIVACATSPTGRRQLMIVSEDTGRPRPPDDALLRAEGGAADLQVIKGLRFTRTKKGKYQ